MKRRKQASEKEAVGRFLERLTGHTISDARKRSDAVLIPYTGVSGARLRRQFWARVPSKPAAYVLVFCIFALIWYLSSLPAWNTESLAWVRAVDMLVGSVLLLGMGFLELPDDIYLDRLTFHIPARFVFDSGSGAAKTTWSSIEQLSIVDLAKGGEKSWHDSNFVLRLEDSTGQHHQFYLSELEREDISRLAAHIRRYAPHIRGLADLDELERFYDYQHSPADNRDQLSYTRLWESCARAQFGLTSFTPLKPGTVLQGHLEVVRQLSAGGFSAVYLVDGGDGERFVLKESVIPSGLDQASKDKAAEQFEREARLLSKINHRQIARVFDHFVEAGRSYMLIEYVAGVNLRDWVESSGRGAAMEAAVVDYARQIASILVYLHGLEPPVVHRDVSPDNVIRRDSGELVLVDFGAASEFIEAATGTLVGKHAYMAPEQIRGAAEPVSDIYSLGALCYFCLTGHDPEPIRCSSPRNHLGAAPVSEWFDRFVRTATGLEREARFTSASGCLHYLNHPDGAAAAGPPEASLAVPRERGEES